MIGTLGVDNIWGAVDFDLRPDIVWLKKTLDLLDSESVGGNGCFLGTFNASPTSGVIPSFPSSLAVSHFSVCADVQLHNRSELFSLLGLAGPKHEWSDARILIAAFEKWGDQCGQHLLGEFAFAIWNSRTRELFCCRDHLGRRPFFYWQRGKRFLFASDVRTILGCPEVPCELNRRKLAGMAVFDGQHYYSQDTFHLGILSLPAGTSMTIQADRVRQQTYWAPEIRAELVPTRTEEAFAALREILFQAVECRIPAGSQASVELSGGLDSSAITAIAARCLEAKGRSLLAVAGVLPKDVDASNRHREDEREFIEEFRDWPNIEIEYVTAPGRGPFDWIEDPARYFATPVRTSRFFLQEALHETARAHNALSTLRGLSGEMGPTCFAKRYYVELAATLQWRTLAHELSCLKRQRGTRSLPFMIRQILDVFQRPAPATEQVLLTDSFRRYGKQWERGRHMTVDQRKQQLDRLRAHQRMQAAWWPQSNEYPIRISQPWLDKRVVEFCLAAPPRLKVRNGYQRNLVREALDGVLPKKIQWRTSKGPFSPNYAFRFNTQLQKALDFVAAIRPNDPVRAVIDVDRLASFLKPADPRNATPLERSIIPSSVYVLCFLRQFSEFRP